MRSVCSSKSCIRILLDFFRDDCTAPMKWTTMIRKNFRDGGGGGEVRALRGQTLRTMGNAKVTMGNAKV